MMRFSSNITNDPTISKIVDQAILLTQDYLTDFALNENFSKQVELAFGDRFNPAKLEELRQQWASGQFEVWPKIEIRPAAEINGANGAFSADTNTVYLSQEYIAQNAADVQAIANVLLEEIGHSVDARINVLDTPGDEGELFSSVIQCKKLDRLDLLRVENDNDMSIVALDGKATYIEQAEDVKISGKVFWLDSEGKKHPVRNARIEVWDKDGSVIDTGGVESDDDLLASNPPQFPLYTDADGFYEASFGNDDGFGDKGQDIYIKVFANGLNHLVQNSSKAAYSFDSSLLIENISSGQHSIRDVVINVPNANSFIPGAFSISDAIYTGELYAIGVRGFPKQPLKVSFDQDIDDAFYRDDEKTIFLNFKNSKDWDVILHEFGHYLADIDKMASSPGGRHIAGISNIVGDEENEVPARGKEDGVRVGWSEGLATYLGIAAQHFAFRIQQLPSRIPRVSDAGVPDTLYTDFHLNIDFGLETARGSADAGNVGEGDEASVARILWDLADGVNEHHDRIAIGHKDFYSVLQVISVHEALKGDRLDRLDNLWQYFSTSGNLKYLKLPTYLTDNAKLAKLGAIFEEYNVSPRLTGIRFSGNDISPNQNRELPITFKLNDSSNRPGFRWQGSNNGANDTFQVIVFDPSLSKSILTSPTLVDTTQWEPSQSEWNAVVGNPGEYHIIITGGDFRPSIANQSKDGPPETGPYWSGAYTFHVDNAPPKKVKLRALLDNGLDTLNVFQSSSNQLLANVPLFGDALQASSAASQAFETSSLFLANKLSAIAENNGLNFLGNLFGEIKNKFTQKFGDATEATVDQIQDAFFELLGPNGAFGSTGILKDSDDTGDAITKEDIELIIDGSIIQFNIKLGGQEKLANISLPSNIGLPWLGFEFNDLNNPGSSTPKAGIDLDYTFDLGFGIDTTTNGFFFETSPSKDLTIALTPSFPNATAKLGFLQVEAQNKGSKIEFSVDLDDGEDGNDQLTIDELNQGNWRFTPNGSADINFHLDSSIAGSPLLPSIGADLNLNWDFTQDDASPAVDFNNVELKLGTFFRNFAGPVFQQIQKVIEPIQPLIDVLDKRVPVLDTFGRGFLDVTGEKGAPDGKVTLLDIVKLREPNAKTSEFLAAVKKTSDFIKNVDELSKQDATIKLGQFDFGDFNVADPTFDRKTINLEETSEEENVVAQLKSLSPGLVTFANDIDPSGSGPQFPILTDPTQAFKLILGQPAELFKYNVPELRFKFGFEQFFPVIGPLGALIEGNLGARVKLALGFDTYGLEQTGDPLDGFYIGNKPDPLGPGGLFDPSKGRESGAELFAGLNAAAAFSAGIARGGVGGGILGTLNLFLNDLNKDNDSTKVHLNEFDPSCIFNPVTGNLSASLNAFIKVGFGFLSYTKRFNIAKATLLDFAVGCTPAEKDNPSRNNGLATLLNGGDLRLNMGSDFAKFRLIGGQPGTDGAEVFAINYKSGTANNATLAVSAFDITRDYSNVNRIIAFAGKEDDTIVIADTVFTPAFLEGDEGNDQLYGGIGNDTLKGEVGDDALFGGKGDDDLLGGDGDDYLEGGAGADTLDGGSNSDNTKGGGDTVSYKDSPVEVRFNVDPSDSSFFIGSGGDAQGDKLRNIEHIEGSNFDDRLLGDKSSNTLEGLRGNDTLEGGGGDDILLGGIGADRLDGGSGRDWTGYVASSAEVKINLETGKASSGDAEGDTLISIEDIKGSIHNDVLIGSRFNNYLDGFLGDDRIIGSSGADTLDGGEGRDWVSYETSANGVNVSLRTGQGQDGDAQGDELVKVKDDKGNNIAFNSFENLEGSLRHDTLEGDIGNNIIKGLSGNDTLKGDGGDDTLIGGSGEDRLDGGDGIDWADYSESSAAVTVNLQFGSGSGADAQGDTFVRINNRSTVENLLGSNFADALFSDDGDNEINPGLSNSQNNEFDVVDGGGGNDLLTLDYSFNDFGTGLFGGFTGSYIGFGPGLGFFRKTSDGNRFQDAVAFSNIEHLKIIGTIQDDEIYGGAGDDILLPGAGDDVIYGGDGNNTIYGDDDDDYLVAGSGNDTLTGGVGNDTIYGGLGSNTINADDGNDVVIDQDVNGKFIDGIPISSSKTYLDGGRGIDTLSIDLSARDADNAYPYGDVTLVNLDPSKESSTEIELLNGSVIKNFEIFKDIRTGISADKIVQLGRVNNVIETGSGSDIVNPGLGFDEVNGGYFDSDQVGGSDTLILDYSVEDTGTGIFADIPSNTPFFGGSYYRYKDEQKLELLDRVEFRYFTRYEITGTSKNDEIYGGAGDDILLPGAGNDTIYGGLGSNIINADDGNDVVIDQDVAGKLVGSLNSSKIYLDGGRGIDTLSIDLSARDGNNLYPYGDITLISLDPSQENTGRIELLNGSVIANFEIFQNIRTGISADQIIQLGRVDNVIQTGSGSDIVNPGLGFDFVDGGYFDLDQGPGSDTLILDYSVEDTGTGIFADIPSNTPFFGGSYYRYKDEQKLELLDRVEFRYFTRYEITGTSKNDRLIGGNGADILRGQSSKDTLYGGLGDDSLFGGDGDDLLLDGDDFPNRDDATSVQVRSGGNDIFRGGNGNDILVGLASNDRLFGEADNDSLFGGEGSDILDGGEGNDILNGFSLFSSQESKDILIGGLGADEFQLGDENHIYYVDNNIGSLDNENFVRITDFNPIEGDILQLHGSPENYSLFVTPESTAIFKGRFGIEGLPADLIAIFEGANIDLKASHVRFVNSATRSSSSFSDSEYSFLALDQAEIIPLENTLVQSNIAESTVQTSNQVEEISTVTLFQAQDSLVSIPIQAQAPELVSSVATLSQVETTDSLFRVTPNNNKGQLLEDLLGDTAGLSKITVELVELIGDGRAFGTFKNDPFELGLGVVISTGRVEDLKGSNSEDGGFTQSGNQDLSRDFAEAGVAGDSISLKIEFDADATKEFLFFQYAFGSEEFAEFGGSPFNDNFSLTLNGFNYARLTDGSTVSINNLVPSPFGPYHPDFIYNPAQTGPVSGETKLDGYTKPLLFQAPLIQNGRNTLVINVQDVNDGIFDSAVFIKGGTVGTKLPTTKTLDGKGGQKSISVNANDGAIEIDDFGGVGRGINPSPATIAEVDTLKFTDARLTARNMLLTQNGSNLEITFEGITDTKVVLTNLALENLDNLRKETGASVNLGNILFSGQTEFQDSYDVLNAESQLSQIPNHNTVTFLNDLNNTIKGFSKSDDVINGQGGNDQIDGLSGDDLLRGGTGNDSLLGNNGDDILVGGVGSDSVTGGEGRDRFILEPNTGVDTITDFQDKHDQIDLSGIALTQLLINQGTGTNRNDALISFNNGGATELLAIVTGVKSNLITSDDFVAV